MTVQPTQQDAKIAIIGAGPIGLELAVAFKRLNIPYRHFEARQIGHTFTWWPRNTSFFSTTERIEIAGIPIQKTNQERTTGEEYLAYLRGVVEQYDLQINTYEPVVDISRQPDGYLLRTCKAGTEHPYFFRRLVLANGDMDFPNRLGIPGEDLPHVSHYFHDPHDYFRTRLLVIGGKNSAVEAALRCFRAGARVTLSYRKADFDEQAVKHWLLPDLRAQIRIGTIEFLPETVPVEITPGQVLLRRLPDAELVSVPADFVLLAIGFRADRALFEKAGIQLTGEAGAPVFNPETMETNLPGVYVAGTAAAGTQTRYRLFIENTHDHVEKIVLATTGKRPEQIGTIPARRYDLPDEDIQSN